MYNTSCMHSGCKRSVSAVCVVSNSCAACLCAQLANASYVWLPLVPTRGGYEIQNLESWSLRDYC